MSGETQASESGWTVDTLNAHYNQRLDDLKAALDERYATQTKATEKAFEAADKAVQAALIAAEKAVLKAETASNAKFESANEFRGQLNDQANTFMPRAEAAAVIAALSEKIDALATRLDRSEGKGAGLNAGWVILGSVVGLALTIIVIYNILRGVSP